MAEAFDNPRLAINRVYTRRGDAGDTDLAAGRRVRKTDPRIEAYGTVDELNSFTGLARESAAELPELAAILLRVQHELFNLGSVLATLPEDLHPKQARVTEAEIAQLEGEIDGMGAGLPALRSFVLPGGSRLNAELHVCRTVCRRAERRLLALAESGAQVDPVAVRYLNRLSDAFFVWSRWAAHASGKLETLWEPNQATSGRNPGQ